MKVSDLFPSRFTSGQDLDGEARIVTIKRVRGEDVYLPEERREARVFVLEVAEFPRPFIMRKTLAEQVAAALGEDEVDRWPGRKIELYPVQLTVGGVRRIGVRARAAKAVDAPRSAAPASAATNPSPVQNKVSSAPAAAGSSSPVEKNEQGEITVNGVVFPRTIGEKDYKTYYEFAQATGIEFHDARQLISDSQNNAQAAYSVARNRYASGSKS